MEFVGDCIDGLLIDLYNVLLDTEARNEGGSRGPNVELLGVTLRLSNPRARLSRSEDRGKPFSALGELLWYLAGSDRLDFIERYIPRYQADAEDGILPGAYGPRLFAKDGCINQIANICNLLGERPGSRRAVIQLFDARDIVVKKSEVPCTTTLQFHLRGSLLHMSTNMRSNDAYTGLPHDVFCFTMLQEMIARRLGADLGEYIHHAGSMHVYDDSVVSMRRYLEEGHQRPVQMPAMPLGDAFALTQKLLAAEKAISAGASVVAAEVIDDPYWSDIVRLIQAFWASGCDERLDRLKSEFAEPMYVTYLETRRRAKKRSSTSKTNVGEGA